MFVDRKNYVVEKIRFWKSHQHSNVVNPCPLDDFSRRAILV